MQKTVLITGCSSGIGRATARTFLADDWPVYATARDPTEMTDLEAAGAGISRGSTSGSAPRGSMGRS